MANLIPRRTALKLLATATVVGATARTKTANAAAAPARSGFGLITFDPRRKPMPSIRFVS